MPHQWSKQLPRAVTLAQELVSSRLKLGDSAIDATTGNGHDTLFLAKLVGSAGKVYGFDIQQTAIDSTQSKTAELNQVQLYNLSHELMSEMVSPQSCLAIMFNLGYLPGAEKQTITEPGSTRAALQAATDLLAIGGILTIVCYTGHTGGPEEASAVQEFASDLDQAQFSVIEYRFLNQRNSPPHLIAVEKKT